MLRSRRFEEAVKSAWTDGKIPGEMHMGIGEEAIVAGIVSQLVDGDAMALDHRSTPPLVMRGVDLTLILKEVMGRPDGLCGGMGGHMHLFSQPHLAGSTGIVGAGGPLCAGFALAAQYLDKNNVAVAFFGDGAFNQGMLMESLNLAAAWKLPAVFVCKNNSWAIATRTGEVTGGDILKLAAGFGMPAAEVDGTDVEACWLAARPAIERAREGGGPSFLMARCPRLEGHYLGDPMIRTDMMKTAGPLMGALAAPNGAPMNERIRSLGNLLSAIGTVRVGEKLARRDPLDKARQRLKPGQAEEVEKEVGLEIRKALEAALP
jgi:pyruvate dehydrogenase E1 component alpha subunit